MLETTYTPTLDRYTAISNLAHLRKEWQAAAEGESLLEISAAVGLLPVDVVQALSLSRAEQRQVLGSELYREALPFLLA